VDNNLSAVIVDPNLTNCDNSNQNTMISHIQHLKSYSQLRDKMWEVIDKEINMSHCDIYR